MPTLTHNAQRHAVVDLQQEQYLSFPDILRLADGRLLCVYREADQHVPSRRRLVSRFSTDNAHTWGPERTVSFTSGHCPRLSTLPDGSLVIVDDGGHLYLSKDHGLSWESKKGTGIRHGVADRILLCQDGTWLTTAHRHVGDSLPVLGQPPTRQVVFVSHNQGQDWTKRSVLASPGNLVLCEAGLVRLPDKSLLALLRENSQVFEPLYQCTSQDDGRTWTRPSPTCLIGHRPTPGLTKDGRLLVTYRTTGPRGGTAAWIGQPEDLGEFAVHGNSSYEHIPKITNQGLEIHIDPNAPAPFYALRPLTDPTRAHATLEACLTVDTDTDFAMRLGAICRIRKGSAQLRLPSTPGEEPAQQSPLVPIPHDQANTILLDYEPGRLTLSVNGQKRSQIDVDKDSVRTRVVGVGGVESDDNSLGVAHWQSISLQINDPSHSAPYRWEWTPSKGQPDARMRNQILELAAGDDSAWCDYGYSGWVEFKEGQYVCVYHHGRHPHLKYVPGETSFIRSTHFSDADFDSP